ncbi:MAG: hypothetical protein FJZ56_06750 [Chlamydiae bacterium]|nr:hypothetical protein [Chlamydiota bacterium]
MLNLNFFTPVSFGDQPKSCTQALLETVDSYFYLGGKKAYVIPGHIQQDIKGTVLTEDSAPFLITALKVLSYLTVILPMIMLIAKAILRSFDSFHIVNVQQVLEEGIDISQEITQKIQQLMPKILNRQNQDDPEIIRYTSSNLVFSLTSVPDLIFKSTNDIDRRFEKMVKAQEVCLAHQLGLLVIPHAKKFNVGGRSFIAEQRFNIQRHESAQEQLHTELSGLNETIRQLAIFIAKTGFSDVEWRNIPIIDDEPSFQGSRRIALIDLEEMTSPVTGIFGEGSLRRGLIRCLSSEEQIDIALTEASRHGIISPYVAPDEVKAKRIEELQNYEQLKQFHARNGILENPRKPIQIDDLSTLDLNLDEQGFINKGLVREPITLQNAVEDVISQINKKIDEAPIAAAVKGMRYMLLNTSRGTLLDYLRIGLNGEEVLGISSDEEENQVWLKRIINALVTKGHIFELAMVNSHGYFVQA